MPSEFMYMSFCKASDPCMTFILSGDTSNTFCMSPTHLSKNVALISIKVFILSLDMAIRAIDDLPLPVATLISFIAPSSNI